MPPREVGRDEIASVVRLDRDRVKDVLDAVAVEGLQRSNDGLLDAIERLNEGQDRLRVENEQLRQLLDLPVGEQRVAIAAYREHEQGSVETLASDEGWVCDTCGTHTSRSGDLAGKEWHEDKLPGHETRWLAAGEGERHGDFSLADAPLIADELSDRLRVDVPAGMVENTMRTVRKQRDRGRAHPRECHCPECVDVSGAGGEHG